MHSEGHSRSLVLSLAEGLRRYQTGSTRDPSSPRHIMSLNPAFRSACQDDAQLIMDSLDGWSQLMDRCWVDETTTSTCTLSARLLLRQSSLVALTTSRTTNCLL